MRDREAFADITALLLPHMSDLGSRRALVERALFGCSLLNKIDFQGDTQSFTIRLIRQLNNYGECATGRPALVILLQTLKEEVGVDHHPRIDKLIANLLSAPPDPAVIPTQMLNASAETKTTLFHVPIHRDGIIIVAVAIILGAIITIGPQIFNSLRPTPTTSASIPTPATPGVVALRDLDIRTGPGAGFSRMNILPAGNSLDIMGISDDRLWYQVLMLDGTTGWILASEIGIRLQGERGVIKVIVPTQTAINIPTETLVPTKTDTAQPRATATLEPTSTPTTVTLIMQAVSMSQPTQVVTAIATPISQSFPCDATVTLRNSDASTIVGQVFSQPRTNSTSLSVSLRVGQQVVIRKVEKASATQWYQIASSEGSLIGWITSPYLSLSDTCPTQ